MRLLLTSGLIIFYLAISSCQNRSNSIQKQYFITQLEEAENEQNVSKIASIFADSAVLYTSDLIPITGHAGIVSIFNYIFSSGNNEWVKYIVDTSYLEQYYLAEVGRQISKSPGQPADTSRFKAIFLKRDDVYTIAELYYGGEENVKREIPELPLPSGPFQIGQSTFYFDESQTNKRRTVAFQIWYPAESDEIKKVVYQTEAVVENSANFLGIPLFMISYFSDIESNSYLDAPVFPNQKFPVLLYNHGYGGFTSVYQTIFEDLASHGYIVVSIGHEDESALFITKKGEVVSNNSDNPFYTARSSELNGSAIGEYQSIILNHDEPQENYEAYKKLIELSPLHNESTRFWTDDTRTVIGKLIELNETDPVLSGAFDFEAIGIFGHSLGGATAGQFGIENTVFKAGMNLDGFQFGDLINRRLKIPFMFVSSNEAGDRYLRATAFLQNAQTDCYQAVIQGFSHSSFTDLEYFLQGDSKIIDLQRELIRTFFDQFLKNKNVEIEKLNSKYPNLTITNNRSSTKKY